jgi:methyltransferase
MQVLLLASVLLLGAQRVAEMMYARSTARRLRQAAARLVAHDGYAAIVVVHGLFFVGCLVEGAWSPWDGFGWWSAAGVLLFFTGQALRYWSMATLGWRWNTRVYVLPAAPLVAGGPYRILRHPIYIGVILELAGFPLAFGLWGTLVVVAMLHPVVLLRRIRSEEHALGLRA